MRVLLLNQFVPPSQAPTARLLGDLARALQAAGHEVSCIGARSQYGAARGFRRILRDITAHLQIAWGVLMAGHCDWIVALSDPMALPATTRFLAALKGASLAHWAMDVYPQTAIVLGAVKEGWVTRLVGRAMRFGYCGCDLLVALDNDMKGEIARSSGVSVEVMPPWPPDISDAVVSHRKGTQRYWLYSGNLGRAHEFETILQAQKILEERGTRWELRFQGGGASRSAAKRMASQLGLRSCKWSDYVPDRELLASLLAADVLIATQKPETRGLLWPSKLALMKHLKVPIAWVGPLDGAVAEWLSQQDTAAGLFTPGDATALADWMETLPSAGSTCDLVDIHEKINSEREAGTQWWLRRLTSKPS